MLARRYLLCAGFVLCALFFYALLATGEASAADDGTTPTPVTTILPISIEPPPTAPPVAPATDTVVVPTATYAEPPTYTPTQAPTRTATQLPTYTPVDDPTRVPTPANTGVIAAPAFAAPIFATEVVTTPATGTATASRTATATPTGTATPTWLPPGPECVSQPGPTVVKLDVPYMHQVMDVGNADGNWACGPTSLAMVLAYYGKLEPWDEYVADQAAASTSPLAAITPSPTSTPSKSKKPLGSSSFSPYVTNAFTLNGRTYSATAPDPRGNQVAGLYGTISPNGSADWSRIQDVIRWNGLSSRLIGASWESVVAALKRGNPVLIGNGLTAQGHILVAIGYTANGQLLVNDPYGNRFIPGYGGTSGKGLFYPWKCMRARTVLEVIGVYPPPPRPTHTPSPTATATITGTGTPVATWTSMPALTVPAGSSAASYSASPPGTANAARNTESAATATRSLPANNPAASVVSLSASGTVVGGTAAGQLSPKGKAAPVTRGQRTEPDKAAKDVKDMAISGSMLSVVAMIIVFVGLRGRRKARTEAAAASTQPEDDAPAPISEQ